AGVHRRLLFWRGAIMPGSRRPASPGWRDRLLRAPRPCPRSRSPGARASPAAPRGRRPGHNPGGFRPVRPRAHRSWRSAPEGGLRRRATFVLRPQLRRAQGRLGRCLAPDARLHQGAHTTTRANLDVGRAGVWLGSMAFLTAPDLRRAVAEVEEMGFGAIWVGEYLAREVFAACAIILAATSRIKVATGIANIWARDPTAMMNGVRALAEAWPNRFVLTIGVSHARLVEARGHHYERPLTAMRTYLDEMAKAPYRAPEPDPPLPIVL